MERGSRLCGPIDTEAQTREKGQDRPSNDLDMTKVEQPVPREVMVYGGATGVT